LPVRGFRAVGVFCFLSAGFALYAAITLTWPGTVLDRLWDVNPKGHAAMAPFGRILGLPFLGLSIVSVIVGRGWLHRRRYAWYAALAALAVNLVSDLVRSITGEWQAGLFGVVVAGLLLAYIAHPRTRSQFS
jgi:hypothetical protein